MDDIGQILDRLKNLENAINQLRDELEDLKDKSDDLQSVDTRDSIKKAFNIFNDLYGLADDLKKQMRRTFRPAMRRSYNYDYDRGFDFDFDFDFSNLGNFINETVQNALSGIETFANSFDFDFTPRSARIRVQPGANLKFDRQTESSEHFPNIDDIAHVKEILSILENKILALDEISITSNIPQNDLLEELNMLNERKLIIQEKQGQKRYLITKLGKNLLHELKDKKNGEQTNN